MLPMPVSDSLEKPPIIHILKLEVDGYSLPRDREVENPMSRTVEKVVGWLKNPETFLENFRAGKPYVFIPDLSPANDKIFRKANDYGFQVAIYDFKQKNENDQKNEDSPIQFQINGLTINMDPRLCSDRKTNMIPFGY